jgi:diguanylate cyclase (GGDEF)-like protein
MPPGTKRRAILVGVLATVTFELIMNAMEVLGGAFGASLMVRRGLWSLVLGGLVGAVLFTLTRVKSLENDTTGIAKRVIAEEQLAAYAHKKTDITVGIIDVNGLKKVNDQLGHAAGDELIQEVVDRLWALKIGRPQRLIARMGGDEFCIIAPGCPTKVLIAEINAVLASPHRFGDWGIASGGVARTRTGSRDVLRCADMAMYRAKQVFYVSGVFGILSYDAVLDGVPVTDGQRPKVRLRGE